MRTIGRFLFREHLATTLAVLAVGGSVAYTAKVADQQGTERRERREAINALACAIQVDARGSLAALVARQSEGIPGDDLIATNKTRLVIAAAELNPSCVIPKGAP